MAKLTFQTIFLGQIGIGEGEEAGQDIFDRFWQNINLGDVDDSMSALLQFEVRSVGWIRNFVTWNASQAVSGMGYNQAKNQQFFLGNIFNSPIATSWTTLTFRIRPGLLKSGNDNVLGIHSRNEQGETSGNRENFGIANIRLFYHLRD